MISVCEISQVQVEAAQRRGERAVTTGGREDLEIIRAELGQTQNVLCGMEVN